MALRSVQTVQVMQFLYRRHPKIRVRLQLPIEPRCSGFLRANAQEIRACLTSVAVLFVTVTVMTIRAIAVTVIAVPMTTVAGLKWPDPTHGDIIF